MESFWPTDIAPEKITTPLSILKEQGVLLGKITKNVLEGEVVSATDEIPSSYDPIDNMLALTMSKVERQVTYQPEPVFYHTFYIKVPSLGNYRYKLFYAHHLITLYPVIMVVSGVKIESGDEETFKKNLRVILSAPETTRIVASLLGQATAGIAV